jgi:hypothetical protein
MLTHARYNECRDIKGFKTDLGNVVRHFREETIKLGKVRKPYVKLFAHVLFLTIESHNVLIRCAHCAYY